MRVVPDPAPAVGGGGVREHRAEHAAHAGVRVRGLRPAPARHPLLVLRLRRSSPSPSTRRRSCARRCGRASTRSPAGRSRRPARSACRSARSSALVVLPQAFRAVIPLLSNIFIALTKNTSIAVAFSVAEATSIMRRLQNEDARATFPLLIVTAAGLPRPDARAQLRRSAGSSGGWRRGRDDLALRRARARGPGAASSSAASISALVLAGARRRDPAAARGDRPVPRDLLGAVHPRRGAADPAARAAARPSGPAPSRSCSRSCSG